MRSIILLLAVTLMFSCVSLKTPKRTDLDPLNAPMVIGKYPVTTYWTAKSSSVKDTVYPVIVWYMFKNSEGSDSVALAQATHIEVSLIDKNHVSTTLFRDDKPLKTDVIKGRLRKGYFRKKHDLSFSGVPPFYWSMSSNKMQFGLGKDNQLFIDQADETNGSILIIMAGTPGFTRSYTLLPYRNK